MSDSRANWRGTWEKGGDERQSAIPESEPSYWDKFTEYAGETWDDYQDWRDKPTKPSSKALIEYIGNVIPAKAKMEGTIGKLQRDIMTKGTGDERAIVGDVPESYFDILEDMQSTEEAEKKSKAYETLVKDYIESRPGMKGTQAKTIKSLREEIERLNSGEKAGDSLMEKGEKGFWMAAIKMVQANKEKKNKQAAAAKAKRPDYTNVPKAENPFEKGGDFGELKSWFGLGSEQVETPKTKQPEFGSVKYNPKDKDDDDIEIEDIDAGEGPGSSLDAGDSSGLANTMSAGIGGDFVMEKGQDSFMSNWLDENYKKTEKPESTREKSLFTKKRQKIKPGMINIEGDWPSKEEESLDNAFGDIAEMIELSKILSGEEEKPAVDVEKLMEEYRAAEEEKRDLEYAKMYQAKQKDFRDRVMNIDFDFTKKRRG